MTVWTLSNKNISNLAKNLKDKNKGSLYYIENGFIIRDINGYLIVLAKRIKANEWKIQKASFINNVNQANNVDTINLIAIYDEIVHELAHVEN